MVIVLLITALGRQRQEDALELKVYLTYIVKGAEKYIIYTGKKRKRNLHNTLQPNNIMHPESYIPGLLYKL